MPRYIAFLRGINVGGHNVTMDRLRALFEELGFEQVETFIASGNVIFESRGRKTEILEKQIESHLKESLGYGVATFIRTASELQAVAGHQPFAAKEIEGASLNIIFLKGRLSDTVRENILGLRTDFDDLHIHDREIYWLCRGKMSESTLFARGLLEKTIAEPATTRKSTTVGKIAGKV